jgi:hypothetical protein
MTIWKILKQENTLHFESCKKTCSGSNAVWHLLIFLSPDGSPSYPAAVTQLPSLYLWIVCRNKNICTVWCFQNRVCCVLTVCDLMAVTLLSRKCATWRGMPLHHRVVSWCRLARHQTYSSISLSSSSPVQVLQCVVRARHPSTHICTLSQGWTLHQWCSSSSRHKEMEALHLQHHLCVMLPASRASNMVLDMRSFLHGQYLQLPIHRSQCDLLRAEVPTGLSPGLTIQIIPRRRVSHTHAHIWSDPIQHSLSR